MSLIRKNILFLFLFAFSGKVFSQGITIGQWRDHLSYRQARAVTEGGGKVYCLAGNGLFSYNKTDNSLTRLNKINGLSGANFSSIAFNKFNNTLVIGYDDGNIDLIQNNRIINIPDIKRAGITGNTTINRIFFINQLAYLATGFGIVVFDTDRNEIKDTYYIGASGSQVNVYDLTSLGDTLFAATESGVFRASLSNPFLANFANWARYPGLKIGTYNTITTFNNKVYVNRSLNLESGAWNMDSLYVYNGGSWSYFASRPAGYTVFDLSASPGNFWVVTGCCIDTYDSNESLVSSVSQYKGVGMSPKEITTDEDNTSWIADFNFGLIKSQPGNMESLYPSGPQNSIAFSMDYYNGEIATVFGALTSNYNNSYTQGIFSSFKDEVWTSHSQEDMPQIFTDTLWDMVSIAIDPETPGNYYIGTWWKGLVEVRNNQITNIYTPANSSLKFNTFRTPVGGLAFDKDHNLWMSNAYTPYGLSVKSGSTWKNFDLSSQGASGTLALTKILITQNNVKWIIAPRSGTSRIIFYDDNGTISNTSDDRINSYKCTTINGITCTEILSMAEDLEGDVWIGTDMGIQVFYSSEDVFSPNVVPQQIFIEQDGHTQILLATETITAIAVDGANRKWIGTKDAGVFLVSADGTKEIFHFDTDNSPIFSNEILDIKINQLTGEVFISTLNGMISYRSTATEGKDEFENVYAYPNPVKRDYEGTIAIKGMVKDADVKITDISGALVYATKAQGGQASWNGKNFKNERVATGVYLVFCSNEDGSKTFITKILFLN